VLQTDANISKKKVGASNENKTLATVDSSWLTQETATSIDGGKGEGSIGAWNQFEANRRLYNVQSTYDENLYTKKLDKTTLTKEQLQRAEAIANEIEHSITSNVHLMEERGQMAQTDMDEEDLYSGVIRTKSRNDDKPESAKASHSSPASAEGVWKRVLQTSSSGRTSTSPRDRENRDGPTRLASRTSTTQSANPSSPSSADQSASKSTAPAAPPGFEQPSEGVSSKSVQPVDTKTNVDETSGKGEESLKSEASISETSSSDNDKSATVSDNSASASASESNAASSSVEKDADALPHTQLKISTAVSETATNSTNTNTAGASSTPASTTKKLNATAAVWTPGGSFVPASTPTSTPSATKGNALFPS
jgi:PAB1-binding protein PBP1